MAVTGRCVKHDEEKLGAVPCGLYPHCERVLKKGDLAGAIMIISPESHCFCWVETPACWSHAEKSIYGVEKDDGTENLRATRSRKSKK